MHVHYMYRIPFRYKLLNCYTRATNTTIIVNRILYVLSVLCYTNYVLHFQKMILLCFTYWDYINYINITQVSQE